MAQPHPQAGLSHSPGAAGQPPIAQRQAPLGEKNLNPQSPRIIEPAGKPPATGEDDRSDSDWGLAPTKPGFTRENKFILFVLLVLVAVFSFVVFRNFQKKQPGSQNEEVAAKERNAPGKTGDKPPRTPDNATDEESGEAVTLAAENLPAEDPFSDGNVPEQPGATTTGENAEELVEETDPSALANADTPPQFIDNSESIESATQDMSPFEEGADPVVADISTGGRRAGRRTHSNRAPVQDENTQMIDEVQAAPDATSFEETPTEPLEETLVETATENLTQVGGESNIQPIRQRAPAATANGFETAQNTTPRGLGNSAEELVTTTPRNAVPKTAPRTATQPRGTNLPPPPLDPNDPKLGGFREGDLVPSANTAYNAGRAPATPVAQFDPQREPLVANVGEYIVRPNDNYWRISRKVYGTARYFAALAKYNENIVPNAKNMKPGIKIATPPKEQLEQEYGDLLPAAAAVRPVGAVIDPPHAPKTPGYFVEPDGQPAYRIGSSDTLSSISQKTLGRSSRWDEIFELNRDRLAGADTLTVGAILRLPPDASQTRVVGKPIENQ